MSCDSPAPHQARRAGAPLARRIPVLALLLCALLVSVSGAADARQREPEQPAVEQPQGAQPEAQPTARGAQAEAHTTEGAGEDEHHEEGLLSTIARLFNFVLLVGTLVYFLKGPIGTYLQSRSTEIRQDLVTAAQMRAAATAQLAEIERKLQSLPAELDALKRRGAEDVEAEKARIAEAGAAERQRLLEQTRREIDTRLRMARRHLVEHAADLAVRVARERITRSITPDDQMRMVDRYTSQLQEAR